MNKKFVKCFKKFALVSAFLLLVAFPNEALAEIKVTTSGAVKKVLKTVSETGKMLGALSPDDVLSFSKKGTGKAQDANVTVKYDKANEKVTGITVNLPQYVNDKNKYSDGPYWFYLENVKLLHNGNEVNTTFETEITDNCTTKGVINAQTNQEITGVKDGDKITATVVLSWRKGNFKLSNGSVSGGTISGGSKVKNWVSRVKYNYNIDVVIDAPKESQVTIDVVDNNSDVVEDEFVWEIIAKPIIEVKPTTNNQNTSTTNNQNTSTTNNQNTSTTNNQNTSTTNTVEEFSAVGSGNAKVVTFNVKCDNNGKNTASASLSLPKEATLKYSGADWKYTFTLQSCALYVNGKKDKDVTATKTQDGVIKMDLGSFTAKDGDSIDANIKLKWKRTKGKKSVTSSNNSYTLNITIPKKQSTTNPSDFASEIAEFSATVVKGSDNNIHVGATIKGKNIFLYEKDLLDKYPTAKVKTSYPSNYTKYEISDMLVSDKAIKLDGILEVPVHQMFKTDQDDLLKIQYSYVPESGIKCTYTDIKVDSVSYSVQNNNDPVTLNVTNYKKDGKTDISVIVKEVELLPGGKLKMYGGTKENFECIIYANGKEVKRTKDYKTDGEGDNRQYIFNFSKLKLENVHNVKLEIKMDVAYGHKESYYNFYDMNNLSETYVLNFSIPYYDMASIHKDINNILKFDVKKLDEKYYEITVSYDPILLDSNEVNFELSNTDVTILGNKVTLTSMNNKTKLYAKTDKITGNCTISANVNYKIKAGNNVVSAQSSTKLQKAVSSFPDIKSVLATYDYQNDNTAVNIGAVIIAKNIDSNKGFMQGATKLETTAETQKDGYVKYTIKNIRNVNVNYVGSALVSYYGSNGIAYETNIVFNVVNIVDINSYAKNNTISLTNSNMYAMEKLVVTNILDSNTMDVELLKYGGSAVELGNCKIMLNNKVQKNITGTKAQMILKKGDVLSVTDGKVTFNITIPEKIINKIFTTKSSHCHVDVVYNEFLSKGKVFVYPDDKYSISEFKIKQGDKELKVEQHDSEFITVLDNFDKELYITMDIYKSDASSAIGTGTALRCMIHKSYLK